jgi:hypothetical protein
MQLLISQSEAKKLLRSKAKGGRVLLKRRGAVAALLRG